MLEDFLKQADKINTELKRIEGYRQQIAFLEQALNKSRKNTIISFFWGLVAGLMVIFFIKVR
jgi:hypothetical protein